MFSTAAAAAASAVADDGVRLRPTAICMTTSSRGANRFGILCLLPLTARKASELSPAPARIWGAL